MPTRVSLSPPSGPQPAATPEPAHPEVHRADEGWSEPCLGLAVRLLLLLGPLAALLTLTHSRILVAAVAGSAAVVLVLSFPSVWGARFLAALLALAPDTITVAHLGGSPLTARTAAFMLATVAILLATVRGRLRARVPAPFLAFVVVVAGVVGAMQNGRPKSLLEFLALIVMPSIIGATLATDRRAAIGFVQGLTAGTLLIIAFALVESLRNHNFLVSSAAAVHFVRAGHVRATAGWAFPTYLSAFLCLTGFFVVHAFRKRWGLPGLAIGATLVSAGVIASQARSGVLGLVVGALAYLLFQRRAGQALRVLLGLGTAFLLLTVLPGAVPASFRDFVSRSLTPGTDANSNVHYRQQLYEAARAAMAQRPLFGYGYGSGKSVSTNALHQFFGNATDLASLPVSLAVQLGYVGAGALFLFLLVAVWRTVRARDLPIRLPLAAGLVACVVAMLGVPVSPPFTWMLLLAGLGWTLLKEQDRPGPEPEPAGEPPTVRYHASRLGGVRRV